MTTEKLHTAIKNKLAKRTTEQLILDATVARLNKAQEESRLIFALILDIIAERMPEQEFDTLFDTLAI